MRHQLIIIGITVLTGCSDKRNRAATSAPAATQPSATSAPAATQASAATRPTKLAKTEFAMLPRETIIATTSVGTIEIRADDWLKRSYTWEGATRSVKMWPRDERWYGSLGIYYPGPGHHWKEHHGITRGVVEEGQHDFDSVEAAMAWIAKPEQQWMPYVYRNDGLMVGWSKNPEREQLSVDVWQILINSKKPTSLPGANDAAVRVSPP
jgi:hypothetical protein